MEDHLLQQEAFLAEASPAPTRSLKWHMRGLLALSTLIGGGIAAEHSLHADIAPNTIEATIDTPIASRTGATEAPIWAAGGLFSEASFHNRPKNGPDVTKIVVTNQGASYALDTAGTITTSDATLAPLFGSAPALVAGEQATTMSVTPDGKGYWIFTNKGRAIANGNATLYGDMSKTSLNGPVIDSVATPSGKGYYMLGNDGGVFSFGDAQFSGSTGGLKLNKPVNGLAPDPDGKGYWLVASDGGIFAFDANFKGSMGGTTLNKEVAGMVPYGDGYLMVGKDGGIFNFSNKEFYGSLIGQATLADNEEVVSVSVMEHGYVMITNSGRTFLFMDQPHVTPEQPIVPNTPPKTVPDTDPNQSTTTTSTTTTTPPTTTTTTRPPSPTTTTPPTTTSTTISPPTTEVLPQPDPFTMSRSEMLQLVEPVTALNNFNRCTVSVRNDTSGHPLYAITADHCLGSYSETAPSIAVPSADYLNIMRGDTPADRQTIATANKILFVSPRNGSDLALLKLNANVSDQAIIDAYNADTNLVNLNTTTFAYGTKVVMQGYADSFGISPKLSTGFGTVVGEGTDLYVTPGQPNSGAYEAMRMIFIAVPEGQDLGICHPGTSGSTFWISLNGILVPANAVASAYYDKNDQYYPQFLERVQTITDRTVPANTQIICGFYINPSSISLSSIRVVPLIVQSTVLAIGRTAAPIAAPQSLQSSAVADAVSLYTTFAG